MVGSGLVGNTPSLAFTTPTSLFLYRSVVAQQTYKLVAVARRSLRDIRTLHLLLHNILCSLQFTDYRLYCSLYWL
jgi:hypothetical protein